MFVDRLNQSLDLGEDLSNISENTDNKTEITINSVKEMLNGLELERFRGTPNQLEELLNKGYGLGIVINQSLNDIKPGNEYNFQKYPFLKLNNGNNRNEIRVHFEVETDEQGNVTKIYIIAGKVMQEVSQDKHENIYNHFTKKVNKYRK
ncbi:MAG: hypothetical protein PHS49_06840 [Candidatus Gracilibacteria bacterium]|nr:hypothetical protein [Candidatus Gracilibacteria bacterium]